MVYSQPALDDAAGGDLRVRGRYLDIPHPFKDFVFFLAVGLLHRCAHVRIRTKKKNYSSSYDDRGGVARQCSVPTPTLPTSYTYT